MSIDVTTHHDGRRVGDPITDRHEDDIDVWAAFDHRPVEATASATHPAESAVPTTPDARPTRTIPTIAQTPRATRPVAAMHSGTSVDRWIVGAVGATVAVALAAGVLLVGRTGDDPVTTPTPTVAGSDVASSAPDTSAAGPAAEQTVQPTSDVSVDVDAGTATETAPGPVAGPPATPEPTPAAPPPADGESDVDPTPTPPTPAALLDVQPTYELDPGVHGVSVRLENDGDAALDYELTNIGDGYAAAAPIGQIESGGAVDLWLDLVVAPGGDGPTPFERIVEITSNGGEATITITGQVEAPGQLVSDNVSLALVDFRATVAFTNVGDLPVEITEIDAPGFTWELLPDEIEAGQTLELDVAVCAGDVDQLPVMKNVPVPGSVDGHAVLGYEYGGHLTIGTVTGTSTVQLIGQSVDLDAPSCEPLVMVPAGQLTFGG